MNNDCEFIEYQIVIIKNFPMKMVGKSADFGRPQLYGR